MMRECYKETFEAIAERVLANLNYILETHGYVMVADLNDLMRFECCDCDTKRGMD